MTVASAGTFALAPTAVIAPFENTIVPFAIGADVTGTMVALRIAYVPLRPVLLRIVDCANALDAISSAAMSAVLRILLPPLRRRVLLRFVRFFLQPFRLLL